MVKPLLERRVDLVFITFFALHLFSILFFECSILTDNGVSYPWWPPKPFVDMTRSYIKTEMSVGKPVWLKTMIAWIFTVFVPYYICAIYAFVNGLTWIQVPSIVYSSMMMAFTSIAFVENYVAGSGRVQLGMDLVSFVVAALLLARTLTIQGTIPVIQTKKSE